MPVSITPTPNGTVCQHEGARALAIPYETGGGEKRQAILGVDDAGAWTVYDTPLARTGQIVARLDGADEEFPEAFVLAVEYVEQQIAYASGKRVEDPLPKAEQRRLSEIQADCQRAAERTTEHPELKRFRQLATELIKRQDTKTDTTNTTEGK